MFLLLSLPSNSALGTNRIIENLKGFDMAKDDITLQLGQRWAEALKKEFGNQNTAKQVARVFDVEVRTARSWLYGSAPFAKHLWLAGQKLGSGFLADLLTPNTKWKTYTNIDKALDLMEKQICQLREEIRNLSEDNGE